MPKSKIDKTPKSLPGKVNKLVRLQKREMFNSIADRNYAQYGKSTEVAGNTAVVQRITSISTGTGLASRLDNNVRLSSLYYRYTIHLADTTNIMRFLILQAKGGWQAANPVATDIFRQASGGGATPFEMPVLTENFHILVDKTINLYADRPIVLTEGTIYKFPQKNIHYSSTTGTTAADGDIFVVTCSDSGAIAHPYVNGFAKLKYYE